MFLPSSLSLKKKSINKNLKDKRKKETHLHWDQASSIALLRIRVAPQSGVQLSPYDIVCGLEFQAIIGVGDMYIDQEVR